MPDYEIKEWNEENFNINILPYVKEAYAAKKYAFVSDYARFYILYKYGGIYFDTDVEMVRPLYDIVARGPFMGCEQDDIGRSAARVAPGLGLGATPGISLYKELLEMYAGLHFSYSVANLKTVVEYTSELLLKHDIQKVGDGILCVEGVYIYPAEYFSPKSYVTRKINITANTRTIHHFAGTWQPWWKKALLRIWVPVAAKYPRMTNHIKRIL